jgi:hypothetical protein
MPTKNKRFVKIILAALIISGFGFCRPVRAQSVPNLPADIPPKYQALINKYVSNDAQLPTFTLPDIPAGSVLSGNLSFVFQATLVTSIEAELTPAGSSVPQASAQAVKLENNYWAIHFNLKNLPDGKYDLSVKLTNPNGQTETGTVPVIIKNTGSAGSSPVAPINQADINQWTAKIQTADSAKIQKNVSQFLDLMLPADWLEKYFHASTCTDENICGALADPDHDGLTNIEEFRLGTDPTNSDTAGLGHTDGWEVQNGRDPLTGQKLDYQSPKDNNLLTSGLYKVLSAAAAKSPSGNGLTLSGSGLPESYLTVFIYSDLPTVLTVKTDADGNWSYTLDPDGGLADGKHEVYVAVTDRTGKITAKSQPLFFVKTAEAVTVIAPTEAYGPAVSSPIANRQLPFMLIALGIAALALVLALTAIGLSAARKNKKTDDQL